MTRFGEILPLGPILIVFGNFFEDLFSIRQNVESSLANFKIPLGKYSLMQMQNIEKIIETSGHTVTSKATVS